MVDSVAVKVVNFLLKVVLRVDDPSGPVMETSHHTSLHVGQMMHETQSGDSDLCA